MACATEPRRRQPAAWTADARQVDTAATAEQAADAEHTTNADTVITADYQKV